MALIIVFPFRTKPNSRNPLTLFGHVFSRPHWPEAHPSLKQAGLNFAVEMPLLLEILETLMEAFPAPSTEIARSSVGAPTPTEEYHSPPIDGLPTWGLIVRAWCGFAFWAMSAHCHPASTVAASSGDVSAGAGEKVESTSSVCENKTVSSAPGTTSGSGSGPLLLLLGWLLSDTTIRSACSSFLISEDGGISASGDKTKARVERTLPDLLALKKGSAPWKTALLGALIRVLSKHVDHDRAFLVGFSEARREETERARAWLDAPLEDFPSSPRAQAMVDHPSCSDCTMGEDIRDVILEKWRWGTSERSDGATGGQEVQINGQVGPRTHPVWLVLLIGVLKRQCNLSNDTVGRLGRKRRRGGRPSSVHQIGHQVTPRDCDSKGTRTRCPVLLPEAVLTEVLTLLPPRAPARVLSFLLRGVATPPESGTCNPSLSASGIGSKSEDKMPRLATQKQNSVLMALGLVWRSEAARNLSAWERFRSTPAEADDAQDRAFGSLQRTIELRRISAASCGPSKSTEAQPDDGLVVRTTHTLRFLLRTATVLSSATWDPTVSDASSAEDVTEGERGSRRASIDGEDGVSAPEKKKGPADNTTASRGMLVDPQGHGIFAAVDSAFGVEAAELWRQLLAARQEYSPGFSSVLNKLAKDCRMLALSVRAGSVLESGPSGEEKGMSLRALPDVRRSSASWRLEFSQTQRSQRDSGEDCRRPERTTAMSQRKRRRNAEQDDLAGKILAPPPPSASLPVLVAVTLALLQAAPEQAENVRMCAWEGGLAMLAWLLASTTSAQPPTVLTPTATDRPAGDRGGVYSDNMPQTAGKAAGVERVIAEVLECLAVVRQVITSSLKAPPGPKFSLNAKSLTPLSQLLSGGIGRSSLPGLVPVGNFAAALLPRRLVASNPAVRKELRELVLSSLAAMRRLPQNVLASPRLLLAISPMLEAVLDMPRSR